MSAFLEGGSSVRRERRGLPRELQFAREQIRHERFRGGIG